MFVFGNTIIDTTKSELKEYLSVPNRGHSPEENISSVACKALELKLAYNTIKGKIASRLTTNSQNTHSLISGVLSDAVSAEEGMSYQIHLDIPHYQLHSDNRPLTLKIDEAVDHYFLIREEILKPFLNHIKEICRMYLSNVYNEGEYIRVPKLLVGQNEDETRIHFLEQIVSIYDFYDGKIASLNLFLG